MKKVGILTQPLSSNYGGVLQCYALYAYLQSKGYEPFILRKNIYPGFFRNIAYSLLRKIPCQNIRNLRRSHLIGKVFAPFIEKHLPLKSEIVYSSDQLEEILKRENLAAVIVGSDQVWRYSYIKDNYYLCYFLSFVKEAGVRRVAYSASFGVDDWEAPDKLQEIIPLLARFDAVSVREVSGTTVCEKRFQRGNVEHTLDPTLLVSPSVYDFLIRESEYDFNHKLCSYILDGCLRKKEIIDIFARSVARKGEVFHLLDFNDGDNFFTIQDWLKSINQSEYVITDSFHGMVFSIIFNKQFAVLVNPGRGASRFYSLAEQLDLSNRLIDASKLQRFDVFDNPIDYIAVNQKIAFLREKSEDFLIKALGN